MKLFNLTEYTLNVFQASWVKGTDLLRCEWKFTDFLKCPIPGLW